MATFDRPGAMPHHHVPEPKETSPMVDRLRLELNRTVRRTVTQAVDAVWVAFEDELTKMTMLPDEGVDNYELFNDCCRRLVNFIDNNMETTPGFVEQMDRLILACHSGATGSVVHSVMTKDLRIRRCNKEKNHVDIKMEPSITDNSESPVISPPNGTIDMAGGELEDAATVGTESRQWVTRKRLSTSNHPSKKFRSKRLKRSLPSESESEEGENKQERSVKEKKDKEGKTQEQSDKKKKRDKQKKSRGQSDKEKKKKSSVRNSLRRVKAVKQTSRRMTCARRLEKDLEHIQESQSNHVDDGAEHEKVRKAKPGKKIRWNLRSRSKSTNDSSESSVADKGAQTLSKANVGTEPDKGVEGLEESDTTGLEEDVDMTEENGSETKALDTGPSEKEVTSEKQTDTTVEREEPVPPEAPDVEMTSNMNGCAEVEETKKKADGCNVPGLEHETEMAIAASHAECEGNDLENDFNVNSDDSGHEQHTEMVLEVDGLGSVALVENNRTHSRSVGTPVRQDTSGVESEINAQVVHDEEAGSNMRDVGNALPEPHADQEYLRDPELVEATSAQNASESQEAEAAAEFDQNKDATSEVDQEPPIPGLCDAGMRTPQQVSHFKACLRKSIQFVDAVFCNPPQGKHCFRNCNKIRSRQCSEGVPCRDKFCRNWHDTEAHTERCKNPLCEFTNRVFLREIMHQTVNHDMETRLLQLQWEEKVTELTLVTTGSTKEQYTPDKLASLEDEVEQLEQRITGAKEVADSLMDKKRCFLVNLSAIGIMPQNDAADGFPDFETHYR